MRFLTLFLITVFCALASAQQSVNGQMRLYLANEVSDNANLSRRIFELRSQFYFDSELNSYISSNLGIEALLQSGSVSFNFQERQGPTQGLRLRHAHVNFHDPQKMTTLSLGVFNPNYYMSWPYWRAIAFPGALLKLSFGDQDFGADINVLQTVASADIASREVNEQDRNPRLTSEGATLYVKKRTWESQLQIFHYGFYELPSQVAHLSRFDGNSVSGNNPQLAEYVYEYNGFGSTFSALGFMTSRWKLGTQISYMENTKAPEGINKGFENTIVTEFRIFNDLLLRPRVGYYRKGSDVFPSYYINNIQTMTNLQGELAYVHLSPLSNKWQLQLYLAQGKAIRATPYQDDFKMIRLNWIQNYEIF